MSHFELMAFLTRLQYLGAPVVFGAAVVTVYLAGTVLADYLGHWEEQWRARRMNNDDERDYAEEAANRRLMMEEDCDCSNAYLCTHNSYVTNPPQVEAAIERNRCAITNEIDCESRYCELHYMAAPLKLKPGERLGTVDDYEDDPNDHEIGCNCFLCVPGSC